jgi:hypothetical protein
MIPPNVERMFAKQMNATTISLASSHASLVSHPDEIAKLILNAATGSSSNKSAILKNYFPKKLPI